MKNYFAKTSHVVLPAILAATLCLESAIAQKKAETSYQDKLEMIRFYNEKGDGKKLAAALKDLNPATPQASSDMAFDIVLKYADTIERSVGVDEAAKALDDAMSKLRDTDHKALALRQLEAARAMAEKIKNPPKSNKPPKSDEELLAYFEAASMERDLHRKLYIVNKKANLLAFVGRTDEALKALDTLAAQVSVQSKTAKAAERLKATLSLIGKPMAEVPYLGTLGEFTSFAALKGKVVILEFSHVPGRTLWGYAEPRIRKFYDESHAKGLEIVSVLDTYATTLYYGNTNALAAAERRAKESQVPWPVIYGEIGNPAKYELTGSQKMVLIDRKGNVRAIADNRSQLVTREYESFQKLAERLLKE